MNKILQNYSDKLSLRETQEAIILMKNFLKKNLNEKLNILEVRSPKITIINQTSDVMHLNNSRAISFDSSNSNEIYYLYNNYSYWLINALTKFDIKNNNGILTEINSINRDDFFNNISSMEKNEIQIEYRFDNKELVFEKIEELANIIYSSIYNVKNSIVKKFPKLKNTLPLKLNIIDFEKEIKQKTNNNIDELKLELSNNNGVYLLKNIVVMDEKNINLTKILYSIESYSVNADKSYSIVKFSNKISLNEMATFAENSEQTMEEYLFAKRRLDNFELRTININIDLDLLGLLILEKAHIIELQSGEFSKEIENFFTIKKLNHL